VRFRVQGARGKVKGAGSKVRVERHGVVDSEGFTLLEVMIAMAILAITLVTVFQSQSQSVSMESQARFLTTASLLAQGKMAELEAADAQDLKSGSGDFGDNFPDYVWEVEVKDSEIATLKRIDMVVTNRKMLVNKAYHIVYYKYLSM
jgi:general secretion pathway protein I